MTYTGASRRARLRFWAVATEDVDDLLERYLEGMMPDAVTKSDCQVRHDRLEKDVEDAISSSSGKLESRIKLWLLGTLFAVIGAGVGGYTCNVIEVGAYRERIDNNTHQLEEMKQVTNRQLEEMKQEVKDLRIEVRNLLFRKEDQP